MLSIITNTIVQKLKKDLRGFSKLYQNNDYNTFKGKSIKSEIHL